MNSYFLLQYNNYFSFRVIFFIGLRTFYWQSHNSGYGKESYPPSPFFLFYGVTFFFPMMRLACMINFLFGRCLAQTSITLIFLPGHSSILPWFWRDSSTWCWSQSQDILPFMLEPVNDLHHFRLFFRLLKSIWYRVKLGFSFIYVDIYLVISCMTWKLLFCSQLLHHNHLFGFYYKKRKKKKIVARLTCKLLEIL